MAEFRLSGSRAAPRSDDAPSLIRLARAAKAGAETAAPVDLGAIDPVENRKRADVADL